MGSTVRLVFSYAHLELHTLSHLPVVAFVKPPDLNQARVNKCLISLVNRKIVRKDNSTVSQPTVQKGHILKALFSTGICIIPLEWATTMMPLYRLYQLSIPTYCIPVFSCSTLCQHQRSEALDNMHMTG